jgi:hypothetical protein
MTKKELEKELELKNKELEIHLDYASIMEKSSASAFIEILSFCEELGDNSQIAIKIKDVILEFLKDQKKLEQQKKSILEDLKIKLE